MLACLQNRRMVVLLKAHPAVPFLTFSKTPYLVWPRLLVRTGSHRPWSWGDTHDVLKWEPMEASAGWPEKPDDPSHLRTTDINMCFICICDYTTHFCTDLSPTASGLWHWNSVVLGAVWWLNLKRFALKHSQSWFCVVADFCMSPFSGNTFHLSHFSFWVTGHLNSTEPLLMLFVKCVLFLLLKCLLQRGQSKRRGKKIRKQSCTEACCALTF